MELVAAAGQLDKARVLELLESLQGGEPKVVERLRFLAETYRFDLLEDILQQSQTATDVTGEQHA